MQVPLKTTFSSLVVAQRETMALHNIQLHNEAKLNAAYLDMGIQAYIGTPIMVRDRVYGTLNFNSKTPRSDPFSQNEVDFLEMMAQSIGRHLERDIFEQELQATLSNLQEKSALFEGAFRHAAIGMAIVGLDGRWLRVNPAVCDIVGYSETALLSSDFQSITHPDDLDKDLEHVNNLLKGKSDTYRMKKRYLHKDGSQVWILLSVALIRNQQGNPLYFVAQIEDINAQVKAENEIKSRQQELEKLNEELHKMARIDTLTGLCNRRQFMENFEQEILRSRRMGRGFSVIVMDVDHFKQYNDRYGHPAGDVALKRIGHVLQHRCRNTDTVARHGGEEFAVLLPETDQEAAIYVANQLRKAISKIDNLNTTVTISLGIASCFPGAFDCPHSQLEDALMKAADQALYQAKRAGRNCVRAEAILTLQDINRLLSSSLKQSGK